MKNLIAGFILWSVVVFAQGTYVARHIYYGAALPATCNPNTGDVFFRTAVVIGPYYCSAPNTWTLIAGAGGSVGGGLSLTTVGVIPRVSAAGTLGASKLSCTASPVTCTFYDDTAGTGSTTLVLRAGAGQGTDLQQWKDSAGTNLANISSFGTLYAPYIVSTIQFYIGAGLDLGMSRTSAGRFQGNSGTAGQWGGFDIGSIAMQALATPGAPTVTPTCGAGCTQTWTYKIVARLADGTTTNAGAAGSTAVQNATIDANNYNTLTWAAVTGATSYVVYRTVSGGTPATTGIIGTVTAATLVDNGLAGGGETAPLLNQTGMVKMNLATPTLSANVCTAGNVWPDASYLYVCTASGVIKRVAIAAW